MLMMSNSSSKKKKTWAVLFVLFCHEDQQGMMMRTRLKQAAVLCLRYSSQSSLSRSRSKHFEWLKMNEDAKHRNKVIQKGKNSRPNYFSYKQSQIFFRTYYLRKTGIPRMLHYLLDPIDRMLHCDPIRRQKSSKLCNYKNRQSAMKTGVEVLEKLELVQKREMGWSWSWPSKYRISLAWPRAWRGLGKIVRGWW